jgi:ATP-dependent Clp protease ATP-binding subunit ClpC
MFKRVREQLKSLDVTIELTDAAKDHLAVEGYDSQLGARPLRRAIQRLVEDPLSEKILWKEFSAGQHIVADAVDDADNPGKRKIDFDTGAEAPPAEPELAGAAEG